MPDIDDDIEQTRSRYLGEAEPFSSNVTKELFKKNFPLLGGVYSFWKSKEQQEIQKEFDNHVLDILKARDQRIEDLEQMRPEVARVVAAAVERIFWGASVEKARKFATVVGAHMHNPTTQSAEDATFFIKALDELSEDDMIIFDFYHRNSHDFYSRRDRHDYWKESKVLSHYEYSREYKRKIFAPTGDPQHGKYTREIIQDEFIARCLRLVGYGLLQPVNIDDESGYKTTVIGNHLGRILDGSWPPKHPY